MRRLVFLLGLNMEKSSTKTQFKRVFKLRKQTYQIRLTETKFIEFIRKKHNTISTIFIPLIKNFTLITLYKRDENMQWLHVLNLNKTRSKTCNLWQRNQN